MDKRKINLLLYISGLHHGGAERVVAALCYNLNRDKYNILVCWHKACGAIGDEIKTRGFEVLGLPEVDENLTPYKNFLALRRVIKKYRIDVVHTHDISCLADTSQCRLMGVRVKHIHTFHFGNYPNLPRKYIFLETVASRVANKLVAVGYEQAKKIQSALHLSGKRLDVIYNGVEKPHAEEVPAAVQELKRNHKQTVLIGSISTLIPQKGIPYLIETARTLKDRNLDCKILVAGNGPLRDELEEKCRQLDVADTVLFLGWVPNAANKLLPYIDIFVQSSLWEANSIVLLEAMSSCLPIVANRVGDAVHIIDNNINGVLTDPEQPTVMADELQALIEDPDKRGSLGQAAGKKYLENYTISKMIEEYEVAYDALAE
ncbi:MAG: glycosyltransferase family 4 protein [Candidatus Thiodiazotropha sp.]